MQKNRKNGFTVHELLITVVIISIIAGVAGPNLSALISERRDEAGVFALWTTLNSAKIEVAKNDAPLILTFDLTNNNFKVYSDSSENGKGETAEERSNKLTDTLIYSLPDPKPGSACPGAADLTLVSSSWKNDGVIVDNNSIFSMNAGHIYLRNRARPSIGYCILVRESSSSVELLKWNGSEWYVM